MLSLVDFLSVLGVTHFNPNKYTWLGIKCLKNHFKPFLFLSFFFLRANKLYTQKKGTSSVQNSQFPTLQVNLMLEAQMIKHKWSINVERSWALTYLAFGQSGRCRGLQTAQRTGLNSPIWVCFAPTLQAALTPVCLFLPRFPVVHWHPWTQGKLIHTQDKRNKSVISFLVKWNYL